MISRKARIYLFLFLSWFLFKAQSAQCQNFDIDSNAIGLIIQDSGQVLGTGFICAHKDLITTCAHLFEHAGKVDSFTYKTLTGEYIAKIVYQSLDRDIAILKLDTVLVHTPIPLAEQFEFKLYDSLVLSGYDITESLIQNKRTINSSPVYVSGYHEEIHGSDTRDLLEFYGIAQPGYSGGPIFKWDGKVYAMLQSRMPNIKNSSEEGKTLNFAIVLDDLYIIFDFLTFQGIIGD